MDIFTGDRKILASLNEERSYFDAVEMSDTDGKQNIMVFGGMDSSGKPLSSIETYLPEDDEWVPETYFQLEQALEGFCAVNFDNSIYIMGGNAASDRVDPRKERRGPSKAENKYYISET